jgi:hypothetical protein
MMQTVSSSETSVNIYQISRCYIKDDVNLHIHFRENLKISLNNKIFPKEVTEIFSSLRVYICKSYVIT